MVGLNEYLLRLPNPLPWEDGRLNSSQLDFSLLETGRRIESYLLADQSAQLLMGNPAYVMLRTIHQDEPDAWAAQ